VEPSFILTKAADPTRAGVIFAMPSEGPMDLIDEIQCQGSVSFLPCSLPEL
jgi:hypothetical protein